MTIHEARFILTEDNVSELLSLLENLARKDDTFDYEAVPVPDTPTANILGEDYKKVFGRAMWVKERLQKKGIHASFRMSKKQGAG